MKLVRISSQAEVGKIADDVEAVRDLGFEHVAYAGMNPLAQTLHHHVTYSAEWSRHYHENGLQAHDPVLLHARRSIAPVHWDALRDVPGGEVFERALDFGMPRNGLTVPVRGLYGDVGLLSVSGSGPQAEWARLVEARMPTLQWHAVRVHDQHVGQHPLMTVLSGPTLSTREREVLQWTAAGRTQGDIATILGISTRTVEVHLSSARTKLSALNTSQAVGRAIVLGLIHAE